MVGKCILLGFHTGGSSSTFEDWARENLLANISSVPSKPSGISYKEWTKEYFVTSNPSGTIPDPASEAKSVLITWAKENFIRVTI